MATKVEKQVVRQGNAAYIVDGFKVVRYMNKATVGFLRPDMGYWTMGKSEARTTSYSISIMKIGDEYKLGGISYRVFNKTTGKWEHHPGRIWKDFGSDKLFREMCAQLMSRISMPTIMDALADKVPSFEKYTFPEPLKVIFHADGSVEAMMEPRRK